MSVEVITGDELRARGATDLPAALALVAGVSVAPGGDGGPAGSVPEIWGLREFDAFLLVVDGVPWGGAFNPALPALDLTDVDRIEVLRGAAPVMYGATSFVGVIHVIHREAGGREPQPASRAEAMAAAAPRPRAPCRRRAVSPVADRRRRTGASRTTAPNSPAASSSPRGSRPRRRQVPLRRRRHHRPSGPGEPAPPRGRGPVAAGAARRQPQPRRAPSTRTASICRPATTGRWEAAPGPPPCPSPTPSATRSAASSRGLGPGHQRPRLRAGPHPDDLYFDSHLVSILPNLQLVAGFDHLYGRAEAEPRPSTTPCR